ncbi:MAG: J domain-containing protein [Leptospiraceae bacterium]|nr:J domain-containing protein [Leptospiraceae bacterium]
MRKYSPQLMVLDEIDEIIEEISSRTVGCHFQVPVGDILEILGMGNEEYFRFRYNRRSSAGSGFSEIPEDFTEQNTHELIDLLEHCGLEDPLGRLEKAGLHFSSRTLIDLQEFFVSVTLNHILSHTVDVDLLDTSLSGCMNPEDGYRFYMDATFDRDQLKSRAVSLFLDYRSLENHALSRWLLLTYLDRSFRTGYLQWDVLFEHCFDDLFPDRRHAPRQLSLDPELQEALQELELDYVPELEQLKKQFRALMFKYHPDRNPDGLEKTRRINSSYSLLLTALYRS